MHKIKICHAACPFKVAICDPGENGKDAIIICKHLRNSIRNTGDARLVLPMMKHSPIPVSLVWTISFAYCIVVFCSCSKSSSSNAYVDIYMAGYSGSGAKYWKNDNRVDLAFGQNSLATCVVVSGNDIYVAGWERGGSSTPMYWKNGNLVNLTDGTNSGYEHYEPGFYAGSIAVSGNDVYVAGYINYGALYGNKTVAKYWKNGNPVALSDTAISSGNAIGVVVSGNDVYVLGVIGGLATYWKNGNPITIADSSQHASVINMAVSGNDVYVVGSSTGGATYWKNGNPVILADTSQHVVATSITVSDADIYVSGYYYGPISNIGALYWKNGIPVNLSGGNSAYCIAVSGNDLYVGGSSSGQATYWKNNNPVPLDQSVSIFSLFLVSK